LLSDLITVAAGTNDGEITIEPTAKNVRDGILGEINNNSALSGLISVAVGTGGDDEITITQTALENPTVPAGLTIAGVGTGAYVPTTPFGAGTATKETFTLDLANKSKSELTFSIGETDLTITTDEQETLGGVVTKLQAELAKYPELLAKYDISDDVTNIVITEKAGETGFTGVAFTDILSAEAEALPIPSWSLTKGLIEVNPDYSGRKGAGAEFMEITTRIDQTTTHDSLQLRLDKLDISDSKFGQFRVDASGLVTINEGGVEYAVGQIAVARFTNNQALEAVGNNNFQATQDSGKAIYSVNNSNTSGMKGESLELSEADLSESLVNLMIFQRAFEANAKSITTADEMLTTLINLKR
jgi:flagellar hook-basal body protein